MTAKKQPAGAAAPDGITWAYGIRTWELDGTSHNRFQWDLTAGARNSAPDWRNEATCGHGLHANQDGWGDWSLLNLSATKIVGIVRWDAALGVDLDGKVKAPWMEVVMTSRDASLGSIYGYIQGKWRERMVAVLKAESAKTTMASGSGGHAAASGSGGHAAATGDYGHAAASGDYGHAAATGDYGHAAASGYKGHAAASGASGIGASLGGGRAKAAETGAIVLTAYGYDTQSRYVLKAIKSGMVGKKIGKTLIKPDTWYALNETGVVSEVAQ